MDEWITIARLSKVRGNRGELLAESFSDDRERFAKLGRVRLFREWRPVDDAEVERAWWHGDRLILKFTGVDSISAAEKLTGCEVRVPRAERRSLQDGEYFQSDLMGFAIEDRASGECLGHVTGWEEYGGPALVEVDKDWLIPFVPGICEVDMSRRSVRVTLPEGLRDLNRP